MDIPPQCLHLVHPDPWNYGLSLLILVGMILSYMPQHIRIVMRRSSAGISPFFILLGAVSMSCSLANILSLPGSRSDAACCRVIDGSACLGALLGIAQIAVQWGSFFLVMFLFLAFFPRTEEPVLSEEPEPAAECATQYYKAVAIVTFCIAHFLVVAGVTLGLLAHAPHRLEGWAEALGVVGAVLTAFQYLPQIATTWRLQRALSLSIPMMCIQTPGSFLFAASLAMRLGAAGWSSWGIYVVTGCLQGTLLVMTTVFELRARKGCNMDADDADEHAARRSGDRERHDGLRSRPGRGHGEGAPLLDRSQEAD